MSSMQNFEDVTNVYSICTKDTFLLCRAFEIGASLLDTYGTALLGLHRRAEVEADDTVLVTAAAGGLGLAAVDLAANVYKAKVLLHYNKLITCMQFSLVEFHDSNRSLEFVEQRIRHRWSAIKALLRL